MFYSYLKLRGRSLAGAIVIEKVVCGVLNLSPSDDDIYTNHDTFNSKSGFYFGSHQT